MASLKGLSAGGVITAVIALVVLFGVLAATLGDVSTAGEELANTNDSDGNALPFASLFGNGGIVILGFMAAILLGVLAMLGLSKKR